MEVYHSSYYHHTHLCRYLLNPLTILSTSSFSTVNLTNLFIILSLTMIAKGDVYLSVGAAATTADITFIVPYASFT